MSNVVILIILKIDLWRDFAAGVYMFAALSSPRFLFGLVKQFCRF